MSLVPVAIELTKESTISQSSKAKVRSMKNLTYTLSPTASHARMIQMRVTERTCILRSSMTNATASECK